ncbi:hypothetical protein CUR178_03141 [Leishmania enriettii]|uniref:Uncharacterized protein n=1 Tax=Leishmania enriettii TaxID=5663 RepID=A0A836GSM6_LEIEN|nr:hypothetical protein CUR178_03141 [Leishmania enriettii]
MGPGRRRGGAERQGKGDCVRLYSLTCLRYFRAAEKEKLSGSVSLCFVGIDWDPSRLQEGWKKSKSGPSLGRSGYVSARVKGCYGRFESTDVVPQ